MKMQLQDAQERKITLYKNKNVCALIPLPEVKFWAKIRSMILWRRFLILQQVLACASCERVCVCARAGVCVCAHLCSASKWRTDQLLPQSVNTEQQNHMDAHENIKHINPNIVWLNCCQGACTDTRTAEDTSRMKHAWMFFYLLCWTGEVSSGEQRARPTLARKRNSYRFFGFLIRSDSCFFDTVTRKSL